MIYIVCARTLSALVGTETPTSRPGSETFSDKIPVCHQGGHRINRSRFVCMKREDQKDATIRSLLLTSVSTCFVHHYAHLQENKDRVTAYGVLFWFCWMWLVAVVGRCVVGCEH